MNSRYLTLISSLAVFLAAGFFSSAQAQQRRGPVELPSVAHAVSAPLRSFHISQKKIFGPARVIPLHRPEDTGLQTNGGGGEAGPAAPTVGNWADADVQTTYNPSQVTLQNVFMGIGFTGKIPPDENLSVGINTTGASPQTQVVLTVNTTFTVYTTSGGVLANGYLSSGLFANMTNSMCSTVDGGDPIVLFDKLDGRWLISQLAYDSTFTDNHLCLAISQTSDAAGVYDTYDIPFGSNLPDYPKLAIWPDGIYFSANIYASNGSTLQFTGAQACSFPRSKVTSPPPGGRLTFACSPANDAGIYYILPADLENLQGTATLPSGPDYYMQFVDNLGPSSGNVLRLYQFDASSGSLNVVSDLTVNDFHEACGGGTCIPQEGTTQLLDSIGDALMYRLSYRVYDTYSQIVANHSVQVNSSDNQTGIRWYALRSDQGGPFYVDKESTFSPDVSTYRWMGSIAQNKHGDLGLEYSTSGVTSVPGISVTGLLNGTDSGMELGQSAYNGSDRSHQGTYSRWGDYSSISVDPTDDCSFWFTNEYVKPAVLSFDFLWNTVIGKFSVGDCSGSTFAVTTGSLPEATVNTTYSAALTASGGTSPYSWSIASGALPAGLTLDGGTGVISGTPTSTGTSNFSVQVDDSSSQTATRDLSITVNPAPSITTSSLPDGTVDASYNATLAASGGTTPYTWAITSGTLPSGLSLDSGTGTISGTPTAAGTSSFTAQVTDNNGQTATQALAITVNAAPISITTSSLPNGTVGTTYSATLAASGGTTPYTWSITSGTLPSGLSLDPGTGTISGTPSAAGTGSFTAQVTDNNGQTATQALSITVDSSLSITTTSLPNGTVNTAYSATLAASGGTTPYTWSIASGSLPSGLSLDPGTGTISGTPTAAGTGSFTAQVTDNNGQTATQALSITIDLPASAGFSISTTPGNVTLKNGQSGSYTVTLTPTGGFTGLVDLGVSGCPGGTTCTFSMSPVSITGTNAVSTQLNVFDNGAGRTSSTLTITGTSEAIPTLMQADTVSLRTH